MQENKSFYILIDIQKCMVISEKKGYTFVQIIYKFHKNLIIIKLGTGPSSQELKPTEDCKRQCSINLLSSDEKITTSNHHIWI